MTMEQKGTEEKRETEIKIHGKSGKRGDGWVRNGVEKVTV